MKSVIIAGHSFDLSVPYAAGHVLTEGESRALNQVRHENIRNNKAKAVKEAGDDAAKLEALRAEIAKYDAEYEFPVAGTPATRMDPLEREARATAKDYIKAKLAEKGRKPSDVPAGMTKEDWDAKYEAEVARLAATDEVLKIAKKALDAKAKRLASIGDELDLG